MTNIKKTPFTNVDDDVISMDFEGNPNIPTANYGNDTLKNIDEVIKKKQRAEKLKKIIDQELTPEKKAQEDEMSFAFNFGSM